MTIFYVSPSVIPSRSANTVHVISMCRAFADSGKHVNLFIRSDVHQSQKDLVENYGNKSELFQITAIRPVIKRGTELFIAINAFINYQRLDCTKKKEVVIVSRNIFAAFLFGVLIKKRIIYETHTPELAGLRKIIQRLLLKRLNVKTIVISEALKKILAYNDHVKGRIYVMHDGAFNDVKVLNNIEKKTQRSSFFQLPDDKNKTHVGYFGQLFAGRGIEIIQGLAKLNRNSLFFVFGGNDSDLVKYKKENKLENVLFMGHVAPNQIKKLMSLMDVLLMPYQKSVSIGIKHVDTAQWMSPIKMFEYMSSGVPIISSDLPVLKEILKDSHNCLLVDPENVEKWSVALNLLINDKQLANNLAINAKAELCEYYTWNKRAEKMLEILNHD